MLGKHNPAKSVETGSARRARLTAPGLPVAPIRPGVFSVAPSDLAPGANRRAHAPTYELPSALPDGGAPSVRLPRRDDLPPSSSSLPATHIPVPAAVRILRLSEVAARRQRQCRH